MGDEYDYAEAAYWENAEEYEAEFAQYRTYSDGIQFPTASPAVTGVGITQPAGWATPTTYPSLAEARQHVKDFEEAYPTFFGWAIRKKAEEIAMRNDQDILTQAEELRAEAERLERIVAEREKYGEDPFKNGSVLKVEMRYRTGSRRSFAYAVVKVAGKFYLTGKLSQVSNVGTNIAGGFTWEQFVAWLSQGDATVWQAKSLQQVF